MLPDRPFVLVGGGAFAIEIATYLADMCKAAGGNSSIVSDVVDSGKPRTADIEKIVGARVSVHRSIDAIDNLADKEVLVCVGNPQIRRKLFDTAAAAGARFGRVVHQSAYVAATAEIGEGVIVAPLSFIGPFAKLEDNVAVNVQAAIGHDAVIEHSSVISPGVQVNGFARCGARFLLI